MVDRIQRAGRKHDRKDCTCHQSVTSCPGPECEDGVFSLAKQLWSGQSAAGGRRAFILRHIPQQTDTTKKKKTGTEVIREQVLADLYFKGTSSTELDL